MAKELPYFQFEPQEYLSGDVAFCSLAAQGLFNHIVSHYWTRSCRLTKKQILKRHNYPELLNELIDDEIIKFDEETDEISIFFLDEQFEKISSKQAVNRENGKKGGRPKKPKKNPTVNPIKSESKGIREDNIIEDNIIEDNISFIETVDEFDFEIFWDLYDKKVGDKEKIKKKYEKLSDNIKGKIFKHIELYKKSQPDKKFRKNPETYINQKSWNDEIIYRYETTGTSKKSDSDKLADWVNS